MLLFCDQEARAKRIFNKYHKSGCDGPFKAHTVAMTTAQRLQNGYEATDALAKIVERAGKETSRLRKIIAGNERYLATKRDRSGHLL